MSLVSSDLYLTPLWSSRFTGFLVHCLKIRTRVKISKTFETYGNNEVCV